MRKIKILRLIIFLALIILIWQSISCSKDEYPPADPGANKDTVIVTKKDTTLTITLHDKPLDTIRKYIKGQWKLQYASGGFCGYCKISYENQNISWSFIEPDRIIHNYNGNIYTDGPITWFRAKPYMSVAGDSTYILNFEDKRAYPYQYIVNRIVRDSLILYNDGSDAQSFYFTKQK